VKRKTKESIVGFILIAPSLLGFTVLYLVPFIISLAYSFTSGIGNLKFVGFDNFKSLFTSGAYILAINNTIRFNFLAIPLIIIIAFLLALLLNRKLFGSRLLQSAFIFPLCIPVAAIVTIWQITFREDGVVNYLLDKFSISPVEWMDSNWSVMVLVIFYLWKNVGYNMILFQAGLASISEEYYEAARLDGASSLYCLKKITIPLIAPTAFFVFIISIINSFKVFREAYLLAGAYPNKNLYLLQHFMNNNFYNLNYQRLSSAALVLFIIIYLLVFIIFKTERRFAKSL